METVFAGYSPENRPVTFSLDDMGRLWITDTLAGNTERFNDEYYYPDSDIRFMLLHEGYHN